MRCEGFILNTLAIIGIAAVIILLLKLTTFQTQNKYIDLIKPLFPSWSFFSNPEAIYRLEYQVGATGEDGEWKPVFKKRSRRLTALFHNPEINFLHAMDTLVHHLVAEIYARREIDGLDFERFSHYTSIHRAVLKEIVKNELRLDSTIQYRFRIRQGSFEGDVFTWEDFFYSKIYPLSGGDG